MSKYILLIIISLILGYASWYDYKTKTIQWFIPVLLFLCACIYLLFGFSDISSIFVCIFLFFFYSLPTLFGFGVGDLLIILPLGIPIGNLDSLFLFLLPYLCISIIWSIYWIYRYKKQEGSFSKSLLFKDFPFIPVIALSFYSWIALNILL
jgi:Flp pilus assembly protein protease CpaA